MLITLQGAVRTELMPIPDFPVPPEYVTYIGRLYKRREGTLEYTVVLNCWEIRCPAEAQPTVIHWASAENDDEVSACGTFLTEWYSATDDMRFVSCEACLKVLEKGKTKPL